MNQWHRVDELYARALEVSVDDRRAFVERASKGDEPLFKELTSLLAMEEPARGFLETYRRSCHRVELDDRRMARYASAEVMRRLIGVAQLPIPPSDRFRAVLLEQSRQMMLTESLEPLWN